MHYKLEQHSQSLEYELSKALKDSQKIKSAINLLGSLKQEKFCISRGKVLDTCQLISEQMEALHQRIDRCAIDAKNHKREKQYEG